MGEDRGDEMTDKPSECKTCKGSGQIWKIIRAGMISDNCPDCYWDENLCRNVPIEKPSELPEYKKVRIFTVEPKSNYVFIDFDKSSEEPMKEKQAERVQHKIIQFQRRIYQLVTPLTKDVSGHITCNVDEALESERKRADEAEEKVKDLKYSFDSPGKFINRQERKIAELREIIRKQREAIQFAYVHNQNMHCYSTKGKLNEELNAQTSALKQALEIREKDL